MENEKRAGAGSDGVEGRRARDPSADAQQIAPPARWSFEELALIAYRPVHIVCADGFEDFLALLDGISIGEAGLTLAGFVRFTGGPDTDRRLEKLIIRLRTAGVTASVFLALVIILTAHLVATEHSPRAAGA